MVNFNFFGNSNKPRSCCGGILTILFLIAAIAFGSFRGIQMIKRDNISNGSNLRLVDPF